MILPMANNRSFYDLIHRQIVVKKIYIKQVIATQSTLHKYVLPHIIDIIEKEPTKETWKGRQIQQSTGTF